MPYRAVVDVMVILTRGDRVLLAQRANTGYMDGWWNVPSGKLDDGEHAADAARREAAEELGIRLADDELALAGVVHCRNPEGEGRLGMFFAVAADPVRQGEAHNAEPRKCIRVGWFLPGALPEPTVPYTAAGLGLYLRSEPFTVLGWDRPPW